MLGVVAFGLPLGAAILLGAITAPTDPVLASDVQVVEAQDRDRLRFSLSAEGGLNDGAAFPFVMLGPRPARTARPGNGRLALVRGRRRVGDHRRPCRSAPCSGT